MYVCMYAGVQQSPSDDGLSEVLRISLSTEDATNLKLR